MMVLVMPAGFFFQFGSVGGLDAVVPSGTTANYYWVMLQYVPIIATLAFATSMVWAGRVVATVWSDPNLRSELENLVQEPSGGPPGLGGIVDAAAKPPSNLKGGLSFKSAVKQVVGKQALAQEKGEESQDQRSRTAQDMVRRTSWVEIAQWTMLYVYVGLALITGNVAQTDYPLWNMAMVPYVVGFFVLGTLLLMIAKFTLRNLRLTLVKREGKQTVEYVASFLGRIGLCLLVQHLCFFCARRPSSLNP